MKSSCSFRTTGTGFKFADNKRVWSYSTQERVRPLRGRVAIGSKPGVRTCVSVRISVVFQLIVERSMRSPAKAVHRITEPSMPPSRRG